MMRSLCPDLQRAAIAVLAAALLLLQQSAAMQFTAMLIGALGGALLCRGARFPRVTPPAGVRMAGAGPMVAVCAGLLLALPLVAARNIHGALAFTGIFYRAGALVFGGGHVVLPLLHDALVPGWVSDETFLSGYGFAQGMPGPLFTFAAYLGAVSAPAHAAAWAILALVAIFLPGLLLACAAVSLWGRLAQAAAAPAILAGINAAVVGVLAAALYNPVCTSGIKSSGDAAVALAGLVLLQRWKVAPILVVAVCVVVSVALAAATGRL
jgi:chromate transporter